jgi:hypothetical protein
VSGNRHGQSGNWPKAMQKARKASEKAGWTWDLRKSGHWTIRDPQGTFVLAISGTFYDAPLLTKALSVLRKAGCPGVPTKN